MKLNKKYKEAFFGRFMSQLTTNSNSEIASPYEKPKNICMLLTFITNK